MDDLHKQLAELQKENRDLRRELASKKAEAYALKEQSKKFRAELEEQLKACMDDVNVDIMARNEFVERMCAALAEDSKKMEVEDQ